MTSSSSSSNYVLYRPEKLCFSDICTYLICGKSLVGSELVDSRDFRSVDVNFITIITWLLQKILIRLTLPIAFLGLALEFTLNLLSFNGGILGFPFRLVTGSLVIPDKESADYRSTSGHVDGRIDYQVSTLFNHLSEMEPSFNETSLLHLSMMASKIAYENKAYVKNVVTHHWKMHFVGLYRFWNEYVGAEETQAFICCDRQENARLIVVAFRGAALARDWITDFDLSCISMGGMGKMHTGFMKALGLQDEKDCQKGWPKNFTGTKRLAYYILRDLLKTLLQQNKGARIIVTGHSLGGALAILFPSILIMHQEKDIMSSLFGVYTFGQPKVGDKEFGKFMMAHLNSLSNRYYRVVFRYDFVPRVPFDNPVSKFTHFGRCFYFRSWYKGEVIPAEPNMNYFDPSFIPTMYMNAWLDFFRALFAGIRHGKYFEETLISLVFRILALLIPGTACHSPRDYLNALKLAKVIIDEEGGQKII